MSSGFTFNQDYNSDDEDESGFMKGQKDSTIVVIDCSASNFDKKGQDEDTNFITSLMVVENLMLNKIVSSNKDLVRIKKKVNSSCTKIQKFPL